MKNKTKPAADAVYKALAAKIRNTTEGLEYSDGRVEIQYNRMYYCINYTIERHYDEVFDIENEFVTVTDWNIEDSEGDPVTNITMNPEEIENYFDKRPNYSDKD